jgi:hypothetical protein
VHAQLQTAGSLHFVPRTLPTAVVTDEDAATGSEPLKELDEQGGLVSNVQQGVPRVNDVKGVGGEGGRGDVLLLEPHRETG